MLKFAFPPTQNPNASQWNIGCVGSLALGLCVGHVHFIFFVLISFALGSRHKRSFQWNMGFKHPLAPAIGGIGLLCFIQKEGKFRLLKCLQKSLTVELILLDGSVDLRERFVRREREL